MRYPKISVVTPNLNQGVFLEQTILSVLNQNYPNLEYIIIDGGSSDNSLSIIKKYEDRLAHWVSEPDNGLYDALNKGFNKSVGEIMMYINSDDILLDKSLHTIGLTFESFKQIRWLNGMNTFIDEKNRIVEIKKPTVFTIYDYLLNNYQWIQQESTCWRRSLWIESGSCFNDKLKVAGDLDLWCRFFLRDKLFYLNTPIGAFRIRKNQLSASSLNTYYEESHACLNHLRTRINSHQKRNFNIIRFLCFFSKVLKYSVFFDLYIIRKIIALQISRLQERPKIYNINTVTLKIE